LGRSVRSLLNKLTAERFEQLFGKLTGLVAEQSFNDEHLAAVVAEISSKAVADHTFCHLYADLCLRLDAHLAKAGEGFTQGASFSSSLQRECKERFERDLNQATDYSALDGLEGEALYEMEVKLKCGRLGNVRFMGQLLLRKLLPAEVVLASAKELLDLRNDAGSAVESLVALLHVIAPKFESLEASFASALKGICCSLRRRVTDEMLPTRIRFLIRDLLEILPRDCLVETSPQAPPVVKRSALTGPRRSFGQKWRPRQ